MPELVEHGVSGLVVTPGDPEALAAAIRQLAGDPALRRRLGAAARERIEGPFHVRHTLAKTRTLYAELSR
jgi:glycosyltransferase involved in cell wall biosynthesis